MTKGRSLPSHLKVADNENGIAVTPLDELALRIRDLAFVHEARERVQGQVVWVGAALTGVVYKR